MIRTYAYKDIEIEEIFAREEEKTNVADVVAEIIAEVRKGGDAALKRYAEQFDGAAPAVFEVSEEERAAAYAQADAAFLEILKEAAAHIRAFHEKQKRTDFVLTEREGCHCNRKRTGIRTVRDNRSDQCNRQREPDNRQCNRRDNRIF